MGKRALVIFGIVGLLLLSITGTVFAAAFYNGSWTTQPTQGNHWWYNNDPNASSTRWIVDDLWSAGNLSTMQFQNSVGVQFHFENEAYKPPSSYCDRLHAVSLTATSLPVSGWSAGNGCGGAGVLEEVKVDIIETSISSGTWYRHIVQFTKSACNVYPNEVNYSFSNLVSDVWMGKIFLDSSCTRTFPSQPAGMIN